VTHGGPCQPLPCCESVIPHQRRARAAAAQDLPSLAAPALLWQTGTAAAPLTWTLPAAENSDPEPGCCSGFGWAMSLETGQRLPGRLWPGSPLRHRPPALRRAAENGFSRESEDACRAAPVWSGHSGEFWQESSTETRILLKSSVFTWLPRLFIHRWGNPASGESDSAPSRLSFPSPDEILP